MSASKESARDAVPDARRAPREFLAHLYRVAVERALPLASMGAHLPAPPATAARWCWAPVRPAARWRKRWTRCGRPMRSCPAWS